MNEVPAGNLLKESLRRTGRWAMSVAFFGGVISDILNPYAPFAAYIALVAAVASVVIGAAAILKLFKMEQALPALVFAVATTVVSGGIWGLQKMRSKAFWLISSLPSPIFSRGSALSPPRLRPSTRR
jgi:hypothetical protein